jgi:tetratricopeptide (TPR) repeat protein
MTHGLNTYERERVAGSAIIVLAAAWLALPTTHAQSPPTVSALFARYVAGDEFPDRLFEEVPVSSVLNQLPTVAERWVDTVAAPRMFGQTNAERARSPKWQQARQRIAAFAIEAAHASLRTGGLDNQPRQRGDRTDRPTYIQALVEWAHSQLGADSGWSAIDEVWYQAAIAVLEIAQLGSAVDHLAQVALLRFPLQPRFILARAVAEEILTSPYAGVTERPKDRTLLDVSNRFREAMAYAAVRDEAELRLGFLETRFGDQVRSLQHIRNARMGLQDPELVYLSWLFEGRALATMGREPEAEAAFRAALDISPGAQSATLGLAASLFQRNQVEQSSRLIDEFLKRPQRQIDPWWTYWIGDGRMWPSLRDAVRNGVR